MAGGAVLAAIASALLTPQTGPYPLLIVMLLSAIVSAFTTIWVIRRSRLVGEVE